MGKLGSAMAERVTHREGAWPEGLSDADLRAAARSVRRARGRYTCGIDGVVPASLGEEQVAGILSKIGEAIQCGDVKKRRLAIPSFGDRVVARAVGSVLARVVEPSDQSFCRRGESVRGALARLADIADAYGPSALIIGLDVRDMYGSVRHRDIREALERVHAPSAWLHLIDGFLRAWAAKRDHGVPAGSPLSSALAELVMARVDQLILGAGIDHARYVDDLGVVAHVGDAPEAVRVVLHHLLEHGLTVNDAKTRACPANEGITFLGATVGCDERGPRVRACPAWVRTWCGNGTRQQKLAAAAYVAHFDGVAAEQIMASAHGERPTEEKKPEHAPQPGDEQVDRNIDQRIDQKEPEGDAEQEQRAVEQGTAFGGVDPTNHPSKGLPNASTGDRLAWTKAERSCSPIADACRVCAQQLCVYENPSWARRATKQDLGDGLDQIRTWKRWLGDQLALEQRHIEVLGGAVRRVRADLHRAGLSNSEIDKALARDDRHLSMLDARRATSLRARELNDVLQIANTAHRQLSDECAARRNRRPRDPEEPKRVFRYGVYVGPEKEETRMQRLEAKRAGKRRSRHTPLTALEQTQGRYHCL